MGRIREFPGRQGLYVHYWHPGERRMVCRRARGTRREAERLLVELEAQAQRQGFGLPKARTNEVEIAELVRTWRAYNVGRTRPRTWQSYVFCLERVLTWLEAHTRPRTVADVRLEHVEAYKADCLDRGLSPRSVAMQVGALRQLFRWAVREERIASNPLEGWRSPRAKEPREQRALTGFEEVKLLDASPPELAGIWKVFLATGLRAGELAAVEWDDVDWDRRRLVVRAETSKSKRSRWLPLADCAFEVLASLRLHVAERPESEDARRFVFVNSRGNRWRGNLSRRLKQCARRAGLPEDVHLHSLRHTFATQAVRHGADVKVLQHLLGHSTATMTLDRYAHELDDGKREEVVAAVGQALGQAEGSLRRANTSS